MTAQKAEASPRKQGRQTETASSHRLYLLHVPGRLAAVAVPLCLSKLSSKNDTPDPPRPARISQSSGAAGKPRTGSLVTEGNNPTPATAAFTHRHIHTHTNERTDARAQPPRGACTTAPSSSERVSGSPASFSPPSAEQQGSSSAAGCFFFYSRVWREARKEGRKGSRCVRVYWNGGREM